MKSLNGVAVAALIAAVTTPAAFAQEAVQWRVEDGGNGHWYRGVSTSNIVDLAQATTIANAVGGYPVTITSPGESQLITTLSDNDTLWASYWAGPVIGLHVDDADCLPGCWVSGERFDYSNWHPGNPDFPATDNCVILLQRNMRRWQNDPCDYGFQGTLPHSIIVEWSADCNGDGIVDYGQILDGTLFDGDNNGIPDCCELGYDCTTNLVANGSFEVGPEQPDCSWVALYPGDTQLAPWVVTQSSVDRLRLSEACTNESWHSYSGEFTVDLDGFSTAGAIEQYLPTIGGRQYQLTLQLTANCGNTLPKRIRVIAGDASAEFQTNCQPDNPQAWVPVTMPFTATSALTTLRLESLSSSGANGPVIDDVRVSPYEPECVADINDDGTVNGADISVLLGYWGQSGKNVVGDITGDGIVNGADLAQLLGSWGPCQ